jgi:hypothetical protein
VYSFKDSDNGLPDVSPILAGDLYYVPLGKEVRVFNIQTGERLPTISVPWGIDYKTRIVGIAAVSDGIIVACPKEVKKIYKVPNKLYKY